MTALRAIPVPDEAPVGSIHEDGFLVTNEQLAMLGGGDVKRGRRVLRNLIADERDRKPINGPVARPANVRIATEADEQAIFDLLIMDLEENAEAVAPTNRERVANQIIRATRHVGQGTIGLIDGPHGFPVATIGLYVDQWWWSTAYYFVKVWDFVHPDHRQSGFSQDLIRFGQWFTDDFSRQFGYRVYELAGVLATRRVHDKARLYRRMANMVGIMTLYPAVPEV